MILPNPLGSTSNMAASRRSCRLASHPSRNVALIAPGLIDVQVNGYGGQEFTAPTLSVEHVHSIVSQMGQFGLSRFCPTVTTASYEVLGKALRTIAESCEKSPATAGRIAGIHLEVRIFLVRTARGGQLRETSSAARLGRVPAVSRGSRLNSSGDPGC